MYFAGQVERRDYVQAYMWFTLANNADARDEVAAAMTPAQIARRSVWRASGFRRNEPCIFIERLGRSDLKSRAK